MKPSNYQIYKCLNHINYFHKHWKFKKNDLEMITWNTPDKIFAESYMKTKRQSFDNDTDVWLEVIYKEKHLDTIKYLVKNNLITENKATSYEWKCRYKITNDGKHILHKNILLKFEYYFRDYPIISKLLWWILFWLLTWSTAKMFNLF